MPKKHYIYLTSKPFENSKSIFATNSTPDEIIEVGDEVKEKKKWHMDAGYELYKILKQIRNRRVMSGTIVIDYDLYLYVSNPISLSSIYEKYLKTIWNDIVKVVDDGVKDDKGESMKGRIL